MTRAPGPGTRIQPLADRLLAIAPGAPIAEDLLGWMAGSARFRVFAEAHRDKIWKKLRRATDGEALRDVRAELQAAHLLLADRRIELAFEAYGSGKAGPDFTVTFRSGQHFNLEVTRLRRVPDATGFGRTLLAKLRQLPPSAPNALVVAIDGTTSDAVDVAATARSLRSSADAKDESFFTDRGFAGTRGFYERYLRLGAVLVWCEGAAGDARSALWINRSARIPLPERAARACVECLRAD